MKLFCPIRRLWIKATPEEHVRHLLLHELIDKLGFPASLLAIEKELSTLPHLQGEQALPERRADVLCYGKNIHPNHALYPLLLIECKAVKLAPRAINQVTGYNQFLKAYFIALVNSEERRFGWYERETNSYAFIPYIPAYQELVASQRLK